jgi:hypothetical protein
MAKIAAPSPVIASLNWMPSRNVARAGIYLSWDGPFPSNSWFHLAAAAGHAVTGKDLPSLNKAIRDCHRAALKDKSELSGLDVPQAKIECQAFTRDGGGTTVSIWINDNEARRGIEDLE